MLRTYYDLGVRYVTLTHSCHNAFADSCGIFEGPTPYHGGLSELGYRLIDEMNRIGMLVDLSHTSDNTARQAIKYSKVGVNLAASLSINPNFASLGTGHLVSFFRPRCPRAP